MSASVLSEHSGYLRDARRNAAYEAALRALVPAGSRVLDLGCGTGLLGLLALRAGAGHVDAVDATPLIEVAKELASANGAADGVRHHRVWSTNLELAERADLVVCDQADGLFGIESGLLDSFADARDRLAKPGAILVPAAVTPLVVPVRSPALRKDLDELHECSIDLDLAPLRRVAAATIWWAEGDKVVERGDELAGTPVDLRAPAPNAVRVAGTLSAPSDGGWDGLACAFRAELAPGVTISNVPGAADAIERPAYVIPLDGRTPVASVEIGYYPHSAVLRWKLTGLDGTIDRSSLDGLLDSALLRRLEPERSPRPTARGRQAVELLGAADGVRTFAALSADLPKEHEGLLDALLADGYLA